MRANARLALLVAAESHSDGATLIDRAVAIAKESAGEVTESGTPVSDLALLLGGLEIPAEEKSWLWLETVEGWTLDWWPGLDGKVHWYRAGRLVGGISPLSRHATKRST